MRNHFDYLIRTGTDWLFRRRSPSLILLRMGAGLFALLLVGWAVSISIPGKHGASVFRFDTSTETPAVLTYGAFVLAAVLVVAGLVGFRREQQELAKKKVIVIEARGLRDDPGSPLVAAIPAALQGRKDQVLVDLRQRVKDGQIVEPVYAVGKLASLPADLALRTGGLDRQDITYVYGGLAPVPLTFLTGVLLDDEGSLVIMDWDRHQARWRELDGIDDGKRFIGSGLDIVRHGCREVTLAISVSYSADLEGVRRKFPQTPVVHLKLEDGVPDAHWSEEKQKALGKQFLETVIALGNLGVDTIHLVLAAPNSVVFRFGRLYDKRNLPKIIVYQYEKSQEPPYPWGVLMPVSGLETANVVSATAAGQCCL